MLLKHIKIFESTSIQNFSDALRVDMMEDALDNIKNNFGDENEPNMNDLLDINDGYPYQTYIQFIPDTNQVIYYEGWSKQCWNSLYNSKPEYKKLYKTEAIEKVIKERLIPIMKQELNLTFVDSEYWFENSWTEGVDSGYIMKITFKIK